MIGAWPLLSWRTFLAKSKSQTSNFSLKKSLLLIGGGGQLKDFSCSPPITWGNDRKLTSICFYVVVQMG